MSDEHEKRQYQRHSWRIPCTCQVAGESFRGFITNVSARGFFIQTRARVASGSELVAMIDYEPTPNITVTGTVARARKAHRSMSSVKRPGIGVLIDSAPEDYYQLVLELEQKA